MNGVQIGDVVAGRYRLDEFVGSGGMATVYRATDQRLGRTVAVKVFLQGAAGRGDEARRVSETRLLASLNHHALVTLHDAHLPEEGLAFLVMEYVDGGTLDARLRRGPLSPEDAAALGVELGEALHVVHSAGIIHRDVKPSNILLRAPLTPRGTVRPALADFGIAYLVDTTRLTTPGTAIGTAAYLAPEQVRGAPPTTASDIYSLGLVLIEALTGRRAFPQQTPMEAVVARLSMQPDIPTEVGFAWRSLLTTMTTTDPDQRPTAIGVAARLRLAGTAPDGDPGTTAAALPVTADESNVGGAPFARGFAGDGTTATKVLATEPTGPMEPTGPVEPTGPTHPAIPVHPAARAEGLRSRTDRGSDAAARRRWTPMTWALTSVALVVAVVLGISIWTSTLPTDAEQPDLPQTGEPLDTRLQELLEAVTP